MPLQVGEILFDPNFVFPDGHTKGKLLIILARSPANDYIVARTTSNPQRKGFAYGCHNDEPDPNFSIPQTKGVFPKDTWVCLDYLYDFDDLKLEGKVATGAITHKGMLPSDILKDLMGCAAGADDTKVQQATAIRNALSMIP